MSFRSQDFMKPAVRPIPLCILHNCASHHQASKRCCEPVVNTNYRRIASWAENALLQTWLLGGVDRVPGCFEHTRAFLVDHNFHRIAHPAVDQSRRGGRMYFDHTMHSLTVVCLAGEKARTDLTIIAFGVQSRNGEVQDRHRDDGPRFRNRATGSAWPSRTDFGDS